MHLTELACPCCLPALGGLGEVPPHGGQANSRRPISCPAPLLLTFATEDSHSGLVRTLGKRVGGNASRVRIPHPPLVGSGPFPSLLGGVVSFSSRPHLRSYQKRVTRQERLKALAPFVAIFALGFLAAWLVKPGPAVVDPASGCTYTSVIPAKVLPKPRSVTVNVYNATKRVGLASITSIDLKTRGFAAGIVGSSSEDIKGIGYIRYGSGNKAAADRLAAYVPGALEQRVHREPGDTSVDLVLGNAFGQIAPDEQVAAILAIPSTQASGKGCPTL